MSTDVPPSSPARYKLKRGLLRPAAAERDTTSAARMELQKMNGHSKDDGYAEGKPKSARGNGRQSRDGLLFNVTSCFSFTNIPIDSLLQL